MELIHVERILGDALRGLGCGKDHSFKNAVDCYQVGYEVAEENGENQKMEAFSRNWRTFLQCTVIIQVDKDGKFSLLIEFPKLTGKEVCDSCKGTGERYKFAKKPIMVDCLKCKDVIISIDGKELIINANVITLAGVDVSGEAKYQRFLGRVVEDCISCSGTGRYVMKDPEFGGSNNLECKTCKGHNIDGRSKTSQVLTKCKTCKGKRKVKIPVIAPELKSTTICKKCEGKGFVPMKNLMNPVIKIEDLADGIKQL